MAGAAIEINPKKKIYLCSGTNKSLGHIKFALIQYENETKQSGQNIVWSDSRDLKSAEKTYGALELEALALIWAMDSIYQRYMQCIDYF